MADASWHRAAQSQDLPTGAITAARAGYTPVMLARLSDGTVVAFSIRCPHQDTSLEEARLWDDNVRCRQHQYLYDPRSGENVFPARGAHPQNLWKLKPGYLPTFPVTERDGWVWVHERPNPPPAAYDPATEEPPIWARPLAADAQDDPADGSVGDEDEASGPQVVGKTVRVPAGSTFELRLPTNPLPGCTWEVDVAHGLLEVVEEELTTGNPPRWRVRVAARAVGEDQVTCAFRQPWDVVPSEIRTYRVLIVRPADG